MERGWRHFFCREVRDRVGALEEYDKDRPHPFLTDKKCVFFFSTAPISCPSHCHRTEFWIADVDLRYTIRFC